MLGHNHTETTKPRSAVFLADARLACEANAGILLIKGSVLENVSC